MNTEWSTDALDMCVVVCDLDPSHSYDDGFANLLQDEFQVHRYTQAIDGVYNT